MKTKLFIKYLLRFLVTFCVIYFGIRFYMGLTIPGNLYSPFLDNHFDFIDGMRYLILSGASLFLTAFGHDTFSTHPYILSIDGGGSIRMVYSCIGFGVMSFWAAFIVANRGSVIQKIKWLAIGLSGLYFINVCRISVLLIALHNGKSMPFGWDHHTWFNLVAYFLIFVMIYFYDRSLNRDLQLKIKKTKTKPLAVNNESGNRLHTITEVNG